MVLKRNYAIFMAALFTVLGFIVSYYLTCRYFNTDADVINSAITWTEINKHGLGVLREWGPTIDNWYLAIYPIHFLVFSVFGDPTIHMLKLISVMQVMLCSITASLIVFSITKNKWSFVLILFFSALSYFSYTVGFVPHIFSHNAINLYGLVCVIILIFTRNNLYATIVISFLSLIASVSDPWFVVAYLLPFLLYSLYINLTTHEKKWYNCAIYAITIAIFFSKVIQKELNVPTARFVFADIDMAFVNLKWFFLGHGRLTNLFFYEKKSLYILSSLIFICYAAYLAYVNRSRNENILLALSLLGVASSFVLGNPEKMEYSARFLANFIYLIPILIIINSGKKWMPVTACLLAVCTASSVWSHTLHAGSNHDADIKEQISFMESNNLNFGYGAYWGAKANSVTWLSGGSVIIRPMMTDPRTGMIYWKSKHSQAFDSWYRQHQGRTFIAVTQDAETCQSVTICLNGMQKQFGKPDEKLTFKNITFLVYDKGIKINDTE